MHTTDGLVDWDEAYVSSENPPMQHVDSEDVLDVDNLIGELASEIPTAAQVEDAFTRAKAAVIKAGYAGEAGKAFIAADGGPLGWQAVKAAAAGKEVSPENRVKFYKLFLDIEAAATPKAQPNFFVRDAGGIPVWGWFAVGGGAVALTAAVALLTRRRR